MVKSPTNLLYVPDWGGGGGGGGGGVALTTVRCISDAQGTGTGIKDFDFKPSPQAIFIDYFYSAHAHNMFTKRFYRFNEVNWIETSKHVVSCMYE